MKISYDPETKWMAIDFNNRFPVRSVIDEQSGVTILYDANGCVVSIELDGEVVEIENPEELEIRIEEVVRE